MAAPIETRMRLLAPVAAALLVASCARPYSQNRYAFREQNTTLIGPVLHEEDVFTYEDDSEIDVFFKRSIHSLVNKLKEVQRFARIAKNYPYGFQVDVHDPREVTFITHRERFQIDGHEEEKEYIDGAFVKEGKINGALNITGLDGETLSLEYRSFTDNNSYEVNVGRTVTIIGDVSSQDVYEHLFSFIDDGHFVKNSRATHIGAIRNLQFFDRDGHPLPKT